VRENWLPTHSVTHVRRVVRLKDAEPLAIGARRNVYPMEMVIVHELRNGRLVDTRVWLLVGIPGYRGKLKKVGDEKIYACDLVGGVFPSALADIVRRSKKWVEEEEGYVPEGEPVTVV